MPEPIQGSLAIQPLTKVAEAAAKDIYSGSKRIAAGALDKLLVEFGSGFEKYIDRNYQKCRKVKTLLHRVDPIPIEEAYVARWASRRGTTILDSPNIFRIRISRLRSTGTNL